ncbi:putative O-linked N-acetylglucosamine transferase, SPINDLY family [Opitutaceae bacterium TAV1]|nr:putative O-linked N-acetylglucosamine transferase, SPINDLY family [Opitutaceae bacterium TAV1]
MAVPADKNLSRLLAIGLADAASASASLYLELRRLEASPGQAVELRLQLASELARRGRLPLARGIAEPLSSRAAEAADSRPFELLGDIAYLSGRLAESEAAYGKALTFNLGQPMVLTKLATTLRVMGRLGEAATAAREAANRFPEHVPAYGVLGAVHRARGEIEESLAALEIARELDPRQPAYTSAWIVTHAYLPHAGDAEMLAAGREWERAHRQLSPGSPPPLASVPAAEGRRLRVGYLSPDFRRHSVAWFFLPLLENHDRSRVDTFCYYLVPNFDDVTRRVAAAAGHWRLVAGMRDAEIASLIRRDRIDVLVDLAGHFGECRPGVFYHRPAPVQVHHAGFCATTGMSVLDARLSDATVDPVAGHRPDSAERIIHLASGMHCYSPLDPLPPVAPAPALKNGFVTFGSFNNFPKINKNVLDAWAQILARTPHSRLVIKSQGMTDAYLREKITTLFAMRGVAAERLDLMPFATKHASHLAAYDGIDIHLDAFPYNGVTTTCDALWAGVPVLTVRGACHRGRIGESILRRAGEASAVADDTGDYVRRAIAWAGDVRRLAAERGERRARVAASPVGDGAAHARSMEDALEKCHAEAATGG